MNVKPVGEYTTDDTGERIMKYRVGQPGGKAVNVEIFGNYDTSIHWRSTAPVEKFIGVITSRLSSLNVDIDTFVNNTFEKAEIVALNNGTFRKFEFTDSDLYQVIDYIGDLTSAGNTIAFLALDAVNFDISWEKSPYRQDYNEFAVILRLGDYISKNGPLSDTAILDFGVALWQLSSETLFDATSSLVTDMEQKQINNIREEIANLTGLSSSINLYEAVEHRTITSILDKNINNYPQESPSIPPNLAIRWGLQPSPNKPPQPPAIHQRQPQLVEPVPRQEINQPPTQAGKNIPQQTINDNSRVIIGDENE